MLSQIKIFLRRLFRRNRRSVTGFGGKPGTGKVLQAPPLMTEALRDAIFLSGSDWESFPPISRIAPGFRKENIESFLAENPDWQPQVILFDDEELDIPKKQES